MKLITHILIFTIIFLSVKPGIDVLSFSSNTEQVCCNSSCSPIFNKKKSNKSNKNKENNSCNPFQICSNCLYVCAQVPFEYLKKTEIFSKLIFDYNSDMTSKYIGNFWQPPRIA